MARKNGIDMLVLQHILDNNVVIIRHKKLKIQIKTYKS